MPKLSRVQFLKAAQVTPAHQASCSIPQICDGDARALSARPCTEEQARKQEMVSGKQLELWESHMVTASGWVKPRVAEAKLAGKKWKTEQTLRGLRASVDRIRGWASRHVCAVSH